MPKKDLIHHRCGAHNVGHDDGQTMYDADCGAGAWSKYEVVEDWKKVTCRACVKAELDRRGVKTELRKVEVPDTWYREDRSRYELWFDGVHRAYICYPTGWGGGWQVHPAKHSEDGSVDLERYSGITRKDGKYGAKRAYLRREAAIMVALQAWERGLLPTYQEEQTEEEVREKERAESRRRSLAAQRKAQERYAHACEALQEILDGDGLELSSLTNYPIQGLGVDQDLVRYALDEIQNAGYALDLVRANIKEVPDE